MKGIKRPPNYKVFGGRRYELAGTAPTKDKRVADSWANFQRRVNNLAARVIKTSSGYEIYIRRKRRR